MRPALFLSLGFLCWAANAHEVRPAYLEINEQTDTQYAVTWKLPLVNGRALPLDPVFPPDCEPVARTIENARGQAAIEQFTLDCAHSLSERDVAVDGPGRMLTDVLVRAHLEGAQIVSLLRPQSPTLKLSAGSSEPILSYLAMGVEHLVLGIDHVLFVVGLMFFVSRIGDLVRTVTAFTVAHSITLGAAAFGAVAVPQGPVEAVIALSIVFLAVEKLRGDTETLTHRHTWTVAFAFGLLHGFGFAGALADIGLPRDHALAALFLFNVGVELGQLAIVAIALAAVAVVKRYAKVPPLWLAQAPLYAVGSIGAYWLIDRISVLGT